MGKTSSRTSTLALALLSGLVGAIIASVPAYWQISLMNSSLETQRDQIEIMQQSLERKVDLIMTVVPSYDFTATRHRNGTVEIGNSTLSISKTQEFYFKMYVSNVGDAFAHLLSYFISINSDSNYTSDSYYSMETVILKPHESTIFNYTFDPSNIPPQLLPSTHCLYFTFTIVSVEMSVSKFVPANLSDL